VERLQRLRTDKRRGTPRRVPTCHTAIPCSSFPPQGAFLSHPCLRVELDFVVQQGSFAPQALPCFLAIASLTAAVSPSTAFPVAPVMRSTLLQRFLAGTRTVSPVAQHALVTVLPLPPRRSDVSHQSACETSCSLRPTIGGSAFGVFLSRPPVGSLSLRPGDSLTAPRTVLSVGFFRTVSSANATQTTGLRLFPRGTHLPTGHASRRWSHYGPKTQT